MAGQPSACVTLSPASKRSSLSASIGLMPLLLQSTLPQVRLLGDGDAVAVGGDAVAVEVGDAVWGGGGAGDGLGVVVGEDVCPGVAVGLAVGEGDGVGEAVIVGLGVGVEQAVDRNVPILRRPDP